MTEGATQERARRGPLIAVPLYRAPQLVAPLFAALARMADELAGIDARVLLLNDSPDDEGLDAALAGHFSALAAACDATLVANAANIGFVRTANRALAAALDEGRDAILLNSDAIPVPGAFAEMLAVAVADPTVGVVGARSDNATICNSPYPEALRPDPGTALAAHRVIERHLPRATPVPTAVGFCLLIRHAMLARFGLFDEVYGGGYNEENDYIRRINRHGFRAVLANRAYVHHLGSVSFAASNEGRTLREIANRGVLDARYPEYGRAVDRWFEGADYRAQRLLSGLVPDHDGRLRLTFDCRGAEGDATTALVAAFAERYGSRWRVRTLASHAIAGCDLTFHDAWTVPSAIAVRIGAPRTLGELVSLGELAPLTAVVVTDAAALDRAALDESGVDTLWQATAETIAAITYADAATREHFRRDIALPADVAEIATDPDALAAAFDVALRGIDYRTLRLRQSRISLHAAHGRAQARMRKEGTGLRRRADALIADLARAESIAAHLAAGFAAFPAPGAGGRLEMLDLRHVAEPGEIVGRLLDAPPVPLRVRLRSPDDARVLLAAAGRGATRIAARAGTVAAETVAAQDWRALLPGPADDAAFVALAYLAALAREPETEEARQAGDALLQGTSREVLLRSLLVSAERRRLLAEHLP